MLINGICFANETQNKIYEYPKDISQISNEALKDINDIKSNFTKENVLIDVNTGKTSAPKNKNHNNHALDNVENYLYIQSISVSNSRSWSIIVNNISINNNSSYKRIGNFASIENIVNNHVIMRLLNPKIDNILQNQSKNGNKIYKKHQNGQDVYYARLGTNEILNLDNYTIISGNMSGNSYYISRG